MLNPVDSPTAPAILCLQVAADQALRRVHNWHEPMIFTVVPQSISWNTKNPENTSDLLCSNGTLRLWIIFWHQEEGNMKIGDDFVVLRQGAQKPIEFRVRESRSSCNIDMNFSTLAKCHSRHSCHSRKNCIF